LIFPSSCLAFFFFFELGCSFVLSIKSGYLSSLSHKKNNVTFFLGLMDAFSIFYCLLPMLFVEMFSFSYLNIKLN